MANTYASLFYHLVFSTRNQASLRDARELYSTFPAVETPR
jgi:hypothetical protein